MKILLPIFLALQLAISPTVSMRPLIVTSPVITLHKSSELYRVGEDNDPVFVEGSKIVFSRWNMENYLSIQVPDGLTITPVSNEKDAEFTAKNFYIKQYDKDTVKFGVVLHEKPITNSWTFQLQGWEDFNFFYQGELTKTEKERGCSRPDEIVGSYAVYHKTKRDHIIGQTNYRVGKFGHFERPKFIDAKGKTVWGDLVIENNTYTVSVSKQFLSEATYPIKANDTFGRTEGASNDYVGGANIAITKCSTAPAGAGSMTSITIYAKYRTAAGYFTPALYSDDGGGTSHPDSRLAYCTKDGGSGTLGADYAATASDLSYGSVSAGTQYWLALRSIGVASPGTAGIDYKYDSGTNVSDFLSDANGGTSNDEYAATWTWRNTYTNELIYIYATYTASGGGSTVKTKIISG